jgi:hypothetical protein
MPRCEKKDIQNKCDRCVQLLFYITTHISIQNMLINITDIGHKISDKCCMKIVKICTIIFVDIFYKVFDLWHYLLKIYSASALVVTSLF